MKANDIEIFALRLGNQTITRAFSKKFIDAVGRSTIHKSVQKEFDSLTAEYYREKKQS